jgi:hypothetical protein
MGRKRALVSMTARTSAGAAVPSSRSSMRAIWPGSAQIAMVENSASASEKSASKASAPKPM